MSQRGRFVVLGAKGFKGDVEGKHFDSSTLLVQLPVSSRSENQVGQDVGFWKFGSSDEYQKIKALGLKFPCLCDLEIEITAKGTEVYDFQPVQTQAPKA